MYRDHRVEALGGRLDVESPAGGFTRLLAILPIEDSKRALGLHESQGGGPRNEHPASLSSVALTAVSETRSEVVVSVTGTSLQALSCLSRWHVAGRWLRRGVAPSRRVGAGLY